MKIWLAPLHGITTYTFRNCLCRHFAGIDFFMSPFLPVQELSKLNVRNWRDIWPENNTLRPIVPQLMGNNPSHFVDTMRVLHDIYGYQDFNWNLGCPVSQVTRHRRGCGLMPFTDEVAAVALAVSQQTNFHFSIKMRLGMHEPTECLRILDALKSLPIDFFVIHPRLGEQMYNGIPDLAGFSEVFQHTDRKIVYSGDIFSALNYENYQRLFPQIDEWMLGRGLLRNPFLAEEINNINCGNKQTRFAHYYQDLVDCLLPTRKEIGTLSNLKELWHYYVAMIHISEQQLQFMLRVDNLSDFMQISLQYIVNENLW